jgi:aspartokinase-like uncharacterized kinase
VSKASIRWVIKFGGSLSQSACLADWLDALARLPCIIVPGGGLFANAVREAQNRHAFDDRLAAATESNRKAAAATSNAARPDLKKIAEELQ